MIQELKAFLLRGNVVDLAVAVIIAAAFGAIVTAFVEQIVNPLIGLIFGQPDLSSIALTIGEGEDATVFGIGILLNAMIYFVLVGTVLFFVVRAANHAMTARKTGAVEETDEIVVEETPEDVLLLREIRDSLRAGTVPQPPPAP